VVGGSGGRRLGGTGLAGCVKGARFTKTGAKAADGGQGKSSRHGAATAPTPATALRLFCK